MQTSARGDQRQMTKILATSNTKDDLYVEREVHDGIVLEALACANVGRALIQKSYETQGKSSLKKEPRVDQYLHISSHCSTHLLRVAQRGN
jgi:hypothetical protein